MAEEATLQRQIKEWKQQVQRLSEEQSRPRSNLQAPGSHQPKEQELRAIPGTPYLIRADKRTSAPE